MEQNGTTDALNEVVNEINEISISDKPDTEEPEEDYGICEECGNKNTWNYWCLQCNSKHFQQNFGNWTSGNKDVDEIIQETQSNFTEEFIEIP
ncbi:13694_t:CDS:2 [Dentiscutata erythropus]|uniref:13694_t:CDS:1 n=1 Tax=Dentiscutata erythropus TaxID=1348616 RepID=A0A9N9C1E9_9GLOM|nr:13694_t:CDS:2 [Dentiscutata erythropus]